MHKLLKKRAIIIHSKTYVNEEKSNTVLIMNIRVTTHNTERDVVCWEMENQQKKYEFC